MRARKILLDIRGSLSFGESMALKAVSLLLALILWITILGFKREEIKKNVKLEPLLPPGVVITNRIPPIQFVLSGPRVLLKDVEKKIHPIRPDLRHTRESVVGFSIREDMIGELPVGVRVTSFYPPNILIRLEEVVERYISVNPSLRGSPADGYELVSARATPMRVAVSGPKSLVQALGFVGTEPIDIDGLKGTKETEVAVELDSSLGYQLSREKLVRVKIITQPTSR